MKGFIVQHSHATIDGKTYVQLFGRLENDESFVVLKGVESYFFVLEKDSKKCAKIFKKYNCQLEKVGLKSFSVEKVVKVVCENFAELGKVRHDIHKKEIDTFEADLNPSQRFMIDEDIYTSIEIAGDYDDSEERVDRVYRNPEIKPADFRKELKIVSVDIEVGEDGSLLCIGIFSKGYKKTFYVSEKELGLKDVISCSSEEDCLGRAN
jgi:DNA polymerase elongation subunit (family B)